MTASVVTFPAFQDMHGNTFIFPGVHNKMGEYEMWQWSTDAVLALGITRVRNLSVNDTGDGQLHYPHVVATAASPGLGFGSGVTTVHIIGGPMFDEVSNDKASTEDSDDRG